MCGHGQVSFGAADVPVGVRNRCEDVPARSVVIPRVLLASGTAAGSLGCPGRTGEGLVEGCPPGGAGVMDGGGPVGSGGGGGGG